MNKLTKTETAALVVFWNKYMKARKAYEDLQLEAAREGNFLGYDMWLAYLEEKQDAFNELVLTIPEIRYTEFWRSVTMLQPQAGVDGILKYRREKEVEREQRQIEKSIIAGTKGKKCTK